MFDYCHQPSRGLGFTLIESMIGIAIAAILLTIAAPSFQAMIERARVKALTEVVYANLQYARGAALKGLQQTGGSDVRVTFSPNPADPALPCFGMVRATANCDCTLPNSCTIDGALRQVTVDSATFPDVAFGIMVDADSNPATPPVLLTTADATATATFDSLRGTATGMTARIWSTRTPTRRLDVTVNGMGRVSVCVPAGSQVMPGYEDC